MVDSLNNTTGVLGALKYLQSSTQDLNGANARVASGLRVATSSEDPTAYNAAASMRGQSASLSVVTMSLSRAESVSDTAIAAGEQISKLLIEMQKTATAAMGEDLTDDQRNDYALQFENQRKQLEQFVSNASFDNDNLLDGSKPLGVSFVADAEATHTLSLKGRNFMPGGPVVTLGSYHDLHSVTNAKQAVDAITESIKNVGDQLQEMTAENKRIEAQKGFVSKLADALASGVSRMVDTDLASESALVQALQVKQQLSSQAVSIANSAPNALLSLFQPIA
ncbi:MAG TPA: flagellin [Hyphomonadaceae bacterium]|nr:flagellin [Hyphomonadaceae bacterium]